ncbi:MAG TPA: RNA polymerase sigma factor [Actinomycetota bacterium]|nr:RNA polymerase sigma factor [Actinomycetota bacterium]
MDRVTGGLPPFDAFLDANGPTVYRFLRVAVGPTDADDVYQETFLSALRGYPKVREGDKLDRWILAIASRKAIDHHRSAGRRPIPTDDLPDTAVDDEPQPVDDALWKAVRALPAKQRVAVVHRHVLDRSYDDIAALMGCSLDAARANVYQGMKRLRELVG